MAGPTSPSHWSPERTYNDFPLARWRTSQVQTTMPSAVSRHLPIQEDNKGWVTRWSITKTVTSDYLMYADLDFKHPEVIKISVFTGDGSWKRLVSLVSAWMPLSTLTLLHAQFYPWYEGKIRWGSLCFGEFWNRQRQSGISWKKRKNVWPCRRSSSTRALRSQSR